MSHPDRGSMGCARCRHPGQTIMLLVSLLSLVATATAQNLPDRQLTVTAAQLMSTAWVDVGLFARLINPLDDQALSGTPSTSILCFNPTLGPGQWAMYAHVPTVQLPYFPYLGLDFKLNPLWSYDKGDVLTCQMWECDGGPAGCNPATPTQLPNAEAGDDLIGQATLSMGAFQWVPAVLLNFTRTPDSKGTAALGSQTGEALLQCDGCRQLWRNNPNWYNTYTTAPAAVPSPPPASPLPSPSPSPSPSPAPAPVPAPSPLPSPSPVVQPSPPPPPPPPVPLPAVEPFQGPASPPVPAPAPIPAPAPAPAAAPPSPALPPVLTPPPPPAPAPPVPEVESPALPPAVLITPPPPPSPAPVPTPPPVEEEPKDAASAPPPPPAPPLPAPVEERKDTTRSILLLVLAVLGGILGVLVVVVAGIFGRRWWVKRRQAKVPAKPTAAQVQQAERQLRIRVQRPAEADAAMRQHKAQGALAEMPWRPQGY